MNKKENKPTGDIGEQIAAEYLEKLGYKILERNLKLFCGEIDILAQDKSTIVIIEVKTVRGSGWGSAADLVRHKKQQKLRLLASAIAKEYGGKNIRIDVVSVDFSGYGDYKISHLKNAVEG
ncbi:YraN family protein [Candidatus Berkelbacteria bacterium CG_4_9_14_0_2_um_filter_42_30]|uniref:UPF0102 protein COX11_02105 n=4 Tax=Candidatus Berkelbacteria TaxID=1618330 RepID=A0A2H0AZJ1_9BACT|nr:MAG: YraN family protein [Candidatus Berkelbacteria bacterium CG23_combo_of_CG06-09_8_20_14_all_41_73]PIR27324.1 MAG: YraN family protein [Candidatus Berkelbacteria bacterium CG11_big_fil_rev_8_21_14_0_20_42_15]PIZ27565.1 MAG: YraN family protein [Candidatus Berkelbacteria bacterium CG_4_10_14_0_8_um_filter_42_34]PJC65956.1 MAG: YraN family protein [Candidatus Berkelbacteria bacterium CG_4_9_14_0_2_um_filter_42_30]